MATATAAPQGLGQGLGHGVGHGVGHGLGHGVAHGVVGDYHNPIPYQFQYGVSDALSGAEFGHQEAEDGHGSRQVGSSVRCLKPGLLTWLPQGSYTVHLPDSRVQHVTYTANDAEGYVAEVTSS